MKNMKKRWSIFAVGIAAVVLVVGAIITVNVKAKEEEKLVIPDRVYIGDVSVAGMTAEEASKAVEEYVEKLEDTPIKLEADGNSIDVTAKDLGVKWGNKEIAEKALNLGRTGNLITRYKEKKDLEKGDKVFSISYDIDKSKVKSLLKENESNLNQDAEDNGLTRENGEFVYVEGHDGIKIKIDESVTAIKSYMNQEWDGKETTIALEAKIVEPRGTEEELAQVQDLLGAYSTDFSSSAAGRAKNVKNGAAKINGTILYPGDEFSVHDAVTPFNEENGYALAGSYENGTTVETYGGGICQVSTTLYNAAIRAELGITERYAHSMIVNYVEPSMDAAISGEYKDLKFKNTTEAPIYIEGYTDGGIIHFNIYGKETREAGREVKFVSETISQTDPGVQYVADGSLPIGTISTSQQAHTGKKAKLWKIVLVNGVEKSREEFNSSTYQASPKIVLVGTMSGNANAVAAINNAIATQDEATISAAAAANCDDAIAAAQAQAAAEAAAKAAQEAAQAVEPQTETQTQTSGKADMLRTP
ncbi:MAG: VanW family protein [Lachnospiraceae bacterium]